MAGGYRYWPFTGTNATNTPLVSDGIPSKPGDAGAPTTVVPPPPESKDRGDKPLAVQTAVAIDAIPWARFKITPVDATSKQPPLTGETPVKLQLLPGDYVIELKNGNLTAPLKETISVAEAPLTRAFQMPGFRADRAVNALLGQKR